VLLLALALPVAVFGPGAVAIAAPAVAGTPPVSAPVSDFLSGRRVGPDLQTRLDASMARLEALSLALRAAVGDADSYARLRVEHDLEVKTHKALTQKANGFQPPAGMPS
jgi:hypothetical protein